MLSMSVFYLLFTGTIFVGLTFALLLWFAGNGNRATNRLLALALIATMPGLIQGLIIGKDSGLLSCLFVVGPLIYFYINKLTRKHHKISWKDLLHFSPFLLGIFIPQLKVLAPVSIILYVFFCRRLFKDFYHQLPLVQMDRQLDEFRWLYRLLNSAGLLCLLSILYLAINYITYNAQMGPPFAYIFETGIAVILIVMNAMAFLKPLAENSLKTKTVQKAPLPLELKQKGAWLKNVLKTNSYHRDPELSLTSLASKLDLTVHELSKIINTVLKKNFNDLINEYRVLEVTRKLQDPAYNHLTFLGIALESGFNSKSSFNRIFKQITGKSPLEYKNGLEKESPSYNLGRQGQFTAINSYRKTTLRWSHEKSNRNFMFKNYFKTAWRNLKNDKIYSCLNIVGLAVGTTCAALIFLWVEDEINFNHNFARHDYLYHVMQNEKSDAGINTNGSTPGPLAAALKADLPGVVNSGRLSWAMDELATSGDKSIKENGMYADPSVLSMYTLPFIYGNNSTALNGPKTIVISETMAQNFFGNSNPVGKAIKMNIKGAYSVDGLYMVTGVFKDLPANCYYHFQWLSPYTTWEDANTWLKPWNNNLTETIVELSSSANTASINSKLKTYLSTKVNKNANECFLFSMNDWHLRGNFVNGVQNGGTIRYVKLFSIIAIIILLIACINFMNLSTARSEQRAKEVGVLKVVGAGKMNLVGKFLSESLLTSFIAMLLAIALLYVLMPYYNTLVQKQLLVDLFKPQHLGFLLSIGITTGIIAGCYPAFYLSSFNPIKVLKGIKVKGSGSIVFIRRGLVITQFAASVILIISTIVVYRQLQHIKDRDLGYNKNNLIYMDLQGNIKVHFNEIRNSLIASGYIENAATSLHDALHVYSVGDGYNWQGKNPNAKVPVHSNVVSAEYLKTMHMKLIDGRDFYPGNKDSTNVVINESMVNLMGKEGKVGNIIIAGKYKLTIVGVIKDFIYNDIYGASAPLILFSGNTSSTVMAVRFKPNANLSQALEKTGAVMKNENPGFPFEYRFADNDFDILFSSETLIGRLAGLFALLAVFISCLGLFGLAAYTAERRTKEIGIRKVLGASVAGLTGLLAKEFLQLVIMSCFIAFPLAWWFMHQWLQNYAYRTTIQYWIFALAGCAALLIALITISFQAIKAAIANPVKSLRSE